MRLMDQVRVVLRQKGYSRSTEETYVRWILEYIRFHRVRHPSSMGRAEVAAFLDHLAMERTVAASTQNQALCALLFLYRDVLSITIGVGKEAFAKKAHTLPAVLSRAEVRFVIDGLTGVYGLIGRLLYGAGLTLSEVVSLRVRDVDVRQHRVLVRDEAGMVHHATVLPDSAAGLVSAQLDEVAPVHAADLLAGFGTASLPVGLRSTGAERALSWQWLFPASRISTDPAGGERRRFHLDPTAIQKAMRKAALAAGVHKRASCQTCATALRFIFWRPVPTCALCRRCSGTRT